MCFHRIARVPIVALAIVGALVPGTAVAQDGRADYLVLDTAKTSTMQKELQEAADRGYRLVPGQGSWVLSAVLERAPQEAVDIEYLLLATSKSGTMQKEMNAASAQGYQFASVLGIGQQVIVAMQRRKGSTVRTHSQTLLATTRISTMQKELLEAATKGFRFVGQTVFEGMLGVEYVAILERDGE